MAFKMLPFLECRTKYFRSKNTPSWMDLAIAVWRALQPARTPDVGYPEVKDWLGTVSRRGTDEQDAQDWVVEWRHHLW